MSRFWYTVSFIIVLQQNTAAESNTVFKETGESVKVKRIASIDNGKMTFELDNGQVATAEQLTFSDNDALLYNAISEMDISAEDANKLLSGYDGSTTMEM